MNHFRQRALVLAVATMLAPFASVQAAEFDAHGFVAASVHDGPDIDTWTRGGIGRFLADDGEAYLQSHLGLHWSSDLNWNAFVHLRADSRRGNGDTLGVVEAKVAWHWFLADDSRLSLTTGQMFIPTTREAVDPLWQSRYSLNLSALNSWIAEEMRPIGIQGALRSAADRSHQWELGLLAFGGNDSAGALLAWRGFSVHDRLSVSTEHLRLPNLPSLAEGGAFSEQQDRGSKPIGRDLDGRIGYAAHARFGQPDTWQLRGALVDTRGDRDLHRGEYAWDTRFSVLGGDWQLHPQWQLVGEWMHGRSGMGAQQGPARVDIDFDAFYSLVSWTPNETWRWSLRWENFDIEDRDLSATEDNSDSGEGFTLSAFWTPSSDWRLAAEWSDIHSDHSAAADLGLPSETAGRSVRVEARYYFD